MKDDLRYLYKLNDYSDIEDLPFKKKLGKAAEGIIEQFYDHFGLSDEHFNITNMELKILDLQCRIALGDEFAKTLLAVEEKRLELAAKHGDDDNTDGYKSFTESTAVLEKWLGFSLFPRETMTISYYTHLENMRKEGDRMERERAKRK